MTTVTWVLESDIFPETHAPLRQVIHRLGHGLIDWKDSWWSDGIPQRLSSNPLVFHGSLGNAALIAEQLDWSPGSFCPVDAFKCSSWYDSAREFLIHRDWRILPANQLIANATAIAEALNSPASLFVRPDSPLKPFSGRVVEVESLTLRQLDYGFYYDDESLPVIAAPVRQIGLEWRFVVVRGRVVAGSRYIAESRSAIAADLDSPASAFASQVATAIPAPADVFVLDVCDCDGNYRLLELNPFGGADLYACDPEAIVKAVTDVAINAWP